MSYREALTKAWQQHISPPARDAPTVVSLFAGAGGSSLGYSMSGFRELLAVEWKRDAAECIRRNFPDAPVYNEDIADLDPSILPIPAGELDVLDGSPPCQGFSVNNIQRIGDDPRNFLYREFARLLRAWNPRAFVMENVPGMIQKNNLGMFSAILEDLGDCGYRVLARVLNADHYGVPQKRVRLIFIGVRPDLGVEPSHPTPVGPPVTVRQALAELPTPGKILRPTGKAALLAPHIRPCRRGADILGSENLKPSFFNLQRVCWDRPSFTISKTFSRPMAGLLHPDKLRYLGTAELCRIQSFPDEYDWGEASYQQIHSALGNSVPPLMMRAIASHLRKLLEGTRSEPLRKGDSLVLGQPADAAYRG